MDVTALSFFLNLFSKLQLYNPSTNGFDEGFLTLLCFVCRAASADERYKKSSSLKHGKETLAAKRELVLEQPFRRDPKKLAITVLVLSILLLDKD